MFQKAFDKVNLLVLFNTLYKKHLSPLTLRLLMNSYCSQKMRIRWNGEYSDTFTMIMQRSKTRWSSISTSFLKHIFRRIIA